MYAVCFFALVAALVTASPGTPRFFTPEARSEPPSLTKSPTYLTQRVIYQPKNGRALYPRHVELEDGTLLATSTNSDFPGKFLVFKSIDFGSSWTLISNITDQVNGWGMSAQLALTELLEPLGGYEPGTILASGNSWSNKGTKIDLYASVDKGRSWEFVSHIAQGGSPNTTNGATPVWEPYLMTYDHQLVCYYSDQRDPKHGQKLAHQTSKDLCTWGPVINDVAYEQYIARPGMTIVAFIKPLNKYIVVHELPIGNSSSYGANYPVYYRMADSPLEFDKAEGIPIVVNGTAPNASPYVVWTPVGGRLGTIIVSDADASVVYANRFGGDRDKWEKHETPQPAAYSRALHIFNKYPEWLMIMGAATFDSGGPTAMSLSITKVKDISRNQKASK